MRSEGLSADDLELLDRLGSGELDLPAAAPAGGGGPADLPAIIGRLESGGGRDVARQPAGMVDPFYGQYRDFATQYGRGAAGINNYAGQMLAARPDTSLGDFYANYVLGTGDAANPRYTAADLAATTVPGAQGAYRNLVSNAGVHPATPLAQLVGGGAGGPGGPSGPGGPLMLVGGAPAHNPLDEGELSQLDQLGAGETLLGPKRGMTAPSPEALLQAGPGGSQVTSTPEALGIPKGAKPVDMIEIMRRVQQGALAPQFRDDVARSILEASQRGIGTWMVNGQPEQHIIPGGIADPKREAYQNDLNEAVRSRYDLVPTVITDPASGAQVRVQMPRAHYLKYWDKSPYAYLEGPAAPGPAAPGAIAPGPQVAGPLPPAGAPPAAPGALPPAAGAAAPAAAPLVGKPGEPQVSYPVRGPAVVAAPPGAPLRPGLTGEVVMPPGAGENVAEHITRDNKTLDQMNAEATAAQNQLGLIRGIQDNLQNVVTGRGSATRDWIGKNVLLPLGVPGDKIQQWVGTDPNAAAYLDKALLGLVTNQMGSIPQGGYGVMQKIQEVFPSREQTPVAAIQMLVNSMRLAAQRSLDLRQQAVDYQNQAEGNYRASGGQTPYSSLDTFRSRFDQENPATDYYRAAQAMTPDFSKEAWAPGTYNPSNPADLTPTGQKFYRFIPPDAPFYSSSGKLIRPEARH